RELEQALHARHPGRFVPHYTMVSFMRVPYAVAHARSQLQRRILVEATAGHADLSSIDWDALARRIEAELPEHGAEGEWRPALRPPPPPRQKPPDRPPPPP